MGKNKVAEKKKVAKKKQKKRLPQKKIPQKKTASNPQGAGSPQIVIDWPKVDALCKIQCTGVEIASVIDVSYPTLERACRREKKINFDEYLTIKKLGGKASLRRRQWKLAEGGNATMLIWLGKNVLDQKDRQEMSGPEGGPVQINVTYE